jgi:thioredoxin-related protein
MRFSFWLTGLLFFLLPGWENNFEVAKQRAEKEHKLILVNFSGSDWCIPCIRQHKEVFDSKTFTDYADANLVLLGADFPRLKKNKLPKEQQKANDELAEKYNPNGIFPLTLLLDHKGKVIKTWEGDPELKVAAFIDQLKAFSYAGK